MLGGSQDPIHAGLLLNAMIPLGLPAEPQDRVERVSDKSDQRLLRFMTKGSRCGASGLGAIRGQGSTCLGDCALARVYLVFFVEEDEKKAISRPKTMNSCFLGHAQFKPSQIRTEVSQLRVCG
jgi:hypothetical protein